MVQTKWQKRVLVVLIAQCQHPSPHTPVLTHWLPCQPLPAVASLGLSSTSDVIPFDQNWHHLCSTSAGGKDLSSDTQIRVIGQMEPEICTKMLKTWSEKLRPKFAATTPGKSCPSRRRFPRSFLTASKPSRRPITAAKTKEKEKKERPKKISKNRKALWRRSISQNFDFCTCPSQNVAKHDASGKKAKLSWCKHIFDQIEANMVKIQPKNHQNVQKTPFSQKAPGFNGLIKQERK